jgi:hypothetical protein
MDIDLSKLTPEQKSNAFLIGSKAEEMGIDPNLALAFAWVENRYQTKGKSPKGAVGVMQVMPANAKSYGYAVEDLQDPNHNIDLGLKIFKDNLDAFNGNERAALVAYNAGPNVAKRYITKGELPNVIPEETKSYLESIHELRPLVISEAEAEESTVFQRPTAGSPETNYFPMDEKDKPREPTYFEEHPALSGFGIGFGAGSLEQLYNYAKKSGDKEATVRLERELLKARDPRVGTMSEGMSGREKVLGFNAETSRQAEDAKRAKSIEDALRAKGIVSGESPRTRFGSFVTSSAESPILVKPEALLQEEPPLTETQKFARRVGEKIPGYRRFAPKVASVARGVSEGASKVMSKFAPISTGLTGLGAGIAFDTAGERFGKGDIKGGLLSSATGVANTLATQPFFPYARGLGAVTSIPLDIANAMYEPSDVKEYYESVTKRFPPKD